MWKKILLGLLIIAFIISFSFPLEAAEDIQLRVNGEHITSQLEYEIEDDSILVPLGVLTDALSVQKRWFEAIDTLYMQRGNRELKLRLGTSQLQVNDRLVNLSTSVERNGDQFMVPMEEIGEALGLIIKADRASREVNIFEIDTKLEKIKYLQEDGQQGIAVKLSGTSKPEVKSLESPHRVVIDFPATKISSSFQKIDPEESSLVKSVRAAQYSSTKTRVVIDLADQADYNLTTKETETGEIHLLEINSVIDEVEYTEDALKVEGTGALSAAEPAYLSEPQRAVIDIENAVLSEDKQFEVDDPAVEKIKVSQYRTDPVPVVRIVMVLAEELRVSTQLEDSTLLVSPIRSELEAINYDENQPRRINLELTSPQEPRVFSLKEGNRLVLDFPSTTNRISDSKLPLEGDLIREVRIGEYDDATRVVLDLNNLVPYQTEWREGSFQITLLNELQNIKVSGENGDSQLDISLLTAGEYEVSTLVSPPRLVIDVPDARVNREELEIINDSNWVRNVRVSQFTVKPYTARIVLDIEDKFDFTVQSPDISQEIALEMSKRNLAGKVVAIDPGHGGSDPGAIGPQGTTEKEVALDIAQETRDLLEKAGAEVVMTREEDTYVSLDERAEVANKEEVDLFVSIHANGHPSDQPDGTETFVRKRAGDSSRTVGSIVQKQLVDRLGTYDRGLKKDSFYVLKNTEMPSILVEVAFITNAEQERLLQDEEFRFDAAAAIYEGISQYFK